MIENLKHLLLSFEELGYRTLLLFDKDGVCQLQGEDVSFDDYQTLFDQKRNQVIRGFDNPARVSFHGRYGLLWIRESFDEQYAMHLKMMDLFFENERLRTLENQYFRMIHSIGRISDTGILVLDRQNRMLYENEESNRMELMLTAEELLPMEEPASVNYDELIKEYPSRKIFRRGLSEGMGTLIYSKGQEALQKDVVVETQAIALEHKIIGQTPVMEEVMNTIHKIAPTDSTVLIRGESGTGKEGFAKLIHDKSERKNEPFIAINCASIPEHLLESELFGYAKGSFTGALKCGKIGKFEAANKGTLFLDEIGDMSLNLQAKLLRVLEEKVIEKVGGTHPIKVDVRIISATHQNLEDMIIKKQFRKDLFYRLNVIPIQIPPLRERVGDIENLTHYYIKKHCIINNRSFLVPTIEVMEYLKAYSWPGNIRELINVIEYIVSIEEGDVITEQMLPREVINRKSKEKPDPGIYKSVEESVRRRVQPITKSSAKPNAKPRKPNQQELLRLLDEFGYSSKNKKSLAKHLGISPATLYRWLKKHEIT